MRERIVAAGATVAVDIVSGPWWSSSCWCWTRPATRWSCSSRAAIARSRARRLRGRYRRPPRGARSRLHRLEPAEVADRLAAGAVLVDIRPVRRSGPPRARSPAPGRRAQRPRVAVRPVQRGGAADRGVRPRGDRDLPGGLPVEPGRRRRLQELGVSRATDVIGGFDAWQGGGPARRPRGRGRRLLGAEPAAWSTGMSGFSPRTFSSCTAQVLPSGSAKPKNVLPSLVAEHHELAASTPRSTSSARGRVGVGDDELEALHRAGRHLALRRAGRRTRSSSRSRAASAGRRACARCGCRGRGRSRPGRGRRRPTRSMSLTGRMTTSRVQSTAVLRSVGGGERPTTTDTPGASQPDALNRSRSPSRIRSRPKANSSP